MNPFHLLFQMFPELQIRAWKPVKETAPPKDYGQFLIRKGQVKWVKPKQKKVRAHKSRRARKVH